MERQATIMSKGSMQCLVASVFDKLTYQNSKGLNCSLDLTLLSQLENLTRVTSAFFFSSSFYYLFFVFGTALSPQCWVTVPATCPAQLAFSSHFCIPWRSCLRYSICCLMVKLAVTGLLHVYAEVLWKVTQCCDLSDISFSHSTPSQELFPPLESLQSTRLKILN